MGIEVNPPGIREAYLRSLNQCFPGWGDANKYAWYFEPRADAPPPDLLVVWNGAQLAAGTGLTYRALHGPDDDTRLAAILTGSWTDPAFRGQGLFTRLVEESRDHARALGYDHLLAFVRNDNPSMKGLLRAGARLIPAFHLRGGSQGTGPDGPLLSAASPPRSLATAWSRFRKRGANSFRFAYNDASSFAAQFFERHSETVELSDERGGMAIVQNEGLQTHVLFVDAGDESPAAAVSLLNAVQRYALHQGRTLMLFTTEENWRVAGSSAGLAETSGSLAVLTDRPWIDGIWTVFGGDRA